MDTFETVIDALAHHAQHKSSKVAFTVLLDGDRSERNFTFAELFADAKRIGGALAALTKPGDRVVIMLPPGSEFLPCLWGCLWAGIVPCVIYPPAAGSGAQGVAPIAAIFRDSGAASIITLAAVRDRLREGTAWSAAGLPELVTFEDLARHPGSGARRMTALSHLQYTSGSTATPKGVCIRHTSLAKHCEQMSWGFGYDASSVGVHWLPTHHSFGMVASVMVPVYLGHRSVLFSPEQFLQRPMRWLEAISRYRGTASGGPNFAYDLVSAAVARGDAPSSPLDLSSWAVAAWGGEAVQPGTLERVRRELGKVGLSATALTPAYGLSEITLSVSGSAPDTLATVLDVDGSALQRGEVIEVERDGSDTVRSIVGLGRPLRGHDLRVVDPETHELTPPNRIGEIWIRGPSIADGYWQRPEETEAVFGGRLADSTGPFLRTGDLGFVHQGEVFVSGRCKELIIVRGLNYFPADIEASVRDACEELAAAPVAAFPWTGPDGEALGVALESSVPPAQFVDKIRSRLAREHGVECGCLAVTAPGTLPRTGSGKLKRLVIAQLAKQGQLQGMQVLEGGDSVAPFPASWGVAAFAAIVRGESGLLPSDFGPETRLSEVSLSSLGVVRVVAEAELRYGHRLSIETLLSGAITVDELVRSVRSVEETSVSQASMPHLADARLSAELATRIRAAAASQAAPFGGDILVTGATGYLGANILQELIANTRATIHCLVRGADTARAESYLGECTERLTGRPRASSERVRIVVGDIAQPRFGLSEADYGALAARVGTVLHAAAHVNFAYPYELLRAANVTGTERVLEFCVTTHRKRLHFLSTIAVLATGNIELPTRPERAALELTPALAIGYEQSKWVADRLVGLARAEGLPACIYRIGFVGGRAADGALLRTNEFFPSFLKGCIQLGEYPALPSGMAAVPVDWVAQVVARKLIEETGRGIDLHLIHPEPLSVSACFERLAARGYALQGVPFDVWKANLLGQAPSALRQSALFDFLSFLRPLSGRHFALPPIHFEESLDMWRQNPCPDASSLLDTCVDRLITLGELPGRSRPA